MKNLPLYLLTLFIILFYQTNLSAQWESISGPEGANYTKLSNNEDFVFAVTPNGIYRSSDDGENWNRLPYDSLNEYNHAPLIINEDTLMCFSRKQYPETGNIISASFDNGNNWSQFTYPDSILFYFYPNLAFKNETIYLQQNQYFIYSTDYGVTWQNSSLGDNFEYTSNLQTYGDGFLVQAFNLSMPIEQNLYYSDGGNDFWTPFIFPTLDTLTSIFEVDTLLFAKTFLGGDTLYQSSDFGQTWNTTNNLEAELTNNTIVRKGDQLYSINSQRLLRSFDNGITWQNYSNHDLSIIYSFIAQNNYILISDFYKGIQRGTSSFSSFAPSNSGIHASNVPYINILNGNDLYAGGFKYDIDNEIWSEDNFSFSAGEVIQVDDKFMRANGEVTISYDNGISWVDVSPPIFTQTSYTHLLKSDNKIFAFGDYDASTTNGTIIYSTENLGQTWTQVTGFKIEKENDLLFSGFQNSLLRSSDNGLTWDTINVGLDYSPLATGGSFHYDEIYSTSERLFLRLSNYINNYRFYTSDNNGDTWESYAGFPPNVGFSIKEIIDFGNILFLYSYGIFISTDNGNSWIPFHDGLSRRGVNCAAVGSEYLYIGTNSIGAFRRSLDDFGLQPISGSVYLDENNNGIWDSNENPLSDMLISAGNALQFTNSKLDGSYSILSNLFEPITLEVHPPFNPDFITVNPENYTITESDSLKNFGVYFNPDYVDLEIDHTVVTPIRPGFGNSISIVGKNVSLLDLAGEIRWVLPNDLSFSNSNPSPDQIIGDTLIWEFSNLGFNETLPIYLNLLGSTNLMLGEEIQLISSISPINSTDVNLANNSDTTHTIVVGSYDPNDKQVEPLGNISPQQLQNGIPLDYTIRFQNTGTYLAETVKIIDELSPFLDLTSLKILDASHPYTYNLSTTGRIEFIFDMINLPDSTSNEMDSHGFIKFSILPYSDLPLNTEIENFANIYFDFNDPIITNQVTTEVAIPPTKINEPTTYQQAIIFPNPTNGKFTIRFNQVITEEINWFLFDMNGNEILRKKSVGNIPIQLNLKGNSAGVYFVKGISEGSYFYGKIILFGE